jgi:hypothetical protein
MGLLFIKCPIAGREFSTGIETDEKSLELIPDTPAFAQCPYCGTRHWWSKRDARLSGAGSPAGKIAAVG